MSADIIAESIAWHLGEAQAARRLGACYLAILLTCSAGFGAALATHQWVLALAACGIAVLFARLTGDEWRVAREETERASVLLCAEQLRARS